MNKLHASRLRAPARELLALAGFLLLTALMTWPWVTRLRDAVSDPGDPYMIAWVLWADYHQTFSDPLNLFHANAFYPHRYSLAFSEHAYGVALLFFPLFALGLKPLTVHSFATFCGFALCGYGAFRLARTLTGSTGAGVVAGVFFAFVPYRFHLLSHLHYLFAWWIPLLLEALVLFARVPTRRRAAWLGFAFAMNALTCVSWMVWSLPPLALSLAYLSLRYESARRREFWLRGGAAMAAAALALLPFLLPYHYASELYGFHWTRQDAVGNSVKLSSWLSAEQRTWLWRGFGDNFGGNRTPLFPGLLPLLLAVAALTFAGKRHELKREEATGENSASGAWSRRRARLLRALDALAACAGVVALLAAGYEGTSTWLGGFFGFRTCDQALFVLCAALEIRLCLAYPTWLPASAPNLRETIRRSPRGDALWLGSVWALAGFLMSLGMNTPAFRFLYDNFFLFRTQRIPSRGAMVAYVGLAVLAGLGAAAVARCAAARFPAAQRARHFAYALVACALLFELRAAPLSFVRGAVFPDEVTLRLKQTPMRGGLVELPSGRDRALEHRYMLRAADHARPLVNGTSSFIPPLPLQIEEMTRGGPIDPALLDLLEGVPVSYVVMHNRLAPPERRPDFERFFAHAVAAGRLRFVKRFVGADDLYAVVKNEPGAGQEEPLPFDARARDWAALIEADPVHLLGEFEPWGHAVHRFYVATFGRPPRMAELLADARTVGAGVEAGVGGQGRALEVKLEEFARAWVTRPAVARTLSRANAEQFVTTLCANAGIDLPEDEREALSAELAQGGADTRASVLLKFVRRPGFERRERARAIVLLHYFGYLRRDPGDAPDRDLSGFDFWVRQYEATGDRGRVNKAFIESPERVDNERRQQQRDAR